MLVEVRGALRFAHRAGLEKGVVAFDDNAYPEFFTSDLWSLTGPFATCERTFEIEADCEYERAFLSMALCAVEGVVDVRLRDAPEMLHLHRSKIGWINSHRDAATFGTDQPKLLEAWADKLAKAAAKPAKPAKPAAKAKAARVVIERPQVSGVAVRPDRTLAISTGRTIAFFDATGALLGEQEAAYRSPNLVALPDGRVIGFSKSNSTSISIASPDAVEVVKPDIESFWVTGAAHANGITTLWSNRAAFVLGRAEPLPACFGEHDSYERVVGRRDGLLAQASSEVAMLELDGSVRWKQEAYGVLELADALVIGNGDDSVSVIGADGAVRATMDTQSIAHGPSKEGGRRAWLVEKDRLFTAGMTSQRVSEWDLATGTRISVAHTHEQSHSGLARVADLTASWCGEPIRGDRDTRVVFSRGEDIVDSFDAKGDVLAALVIGDALAVRTKTKLFVWRAGAVATLGGHKGAIEGFAALGDELVSWGADNTVRIWSL